MMAEKLKERVADTAGGRLASTIRESSHSFGGNSLGGEGDGNTVYVVEVQQAGVFALAGFEPNVLDALLGTQCPNVLYPYARQVIGDLIQAGGFAPFLLQPINFDALYAEGLRQRQAQGAGGDLATSETAGNA